MRFLRGLSLGLAGSLLACGIGSDLDDYSGGAAPQAQGKAGGTSAGAGQAGASAGQAGAGQAGASAGQAGASAGQAGASAGQAGAGQAGAAGKSGAGGASTGLIGAPCKPDDTYTCLGAAQPVVLKCTAGAWQNVLSCADGKLCDGALGPTVGDRCAPIIPACLGQKPGASLCKGVDRITCGPDLVTADKQQCASPAHCAVSAGSTCAECLPGTFACDGAKLSKCGAKLVFEALQTCASPAQCNAASGACTSAVCVAGTFKCSGSSLQRCNSAGTGYDTVEQCGAKICDPVGGQCDVCDAGVVSCRDEHTIEKCSDDGQQQSVKPCLSLTAPFCVGADKCVECRTAADCPQVNQTCLTRACDSGKCGVAPLPAGTPMKDFVGNCLAPRCDGMGRQEIDLGDTPPEDGTCTLPICGPDPLYVQVGEGEACGTQGICKLGVCKCVPKPIFEACAGRECGTAPDGCGKTFQCGSGCGDGEDCCPDGMCSPSCNF